MNNNDIMDDSTPEMEDCIAPADYKNRCRFCCHCSHETMRCMRVGRNGLHGICWMAKGEEY